MPLKRATEQKLESVSIKIVGLACALVLLHVAFVLSGWILRDLHIVNYPIDPRYGSTMPLTGFGLLLSTVALWLLRVEENVTQTTRWIAWTCAGTVVLLGALVVIDYIPGIRVGIDLLLFPKAVDALMADSRLPGRPALATAICFIPVGLALLCLDGRSKTAQRILEFMLLFVLMLSLERCISYLYRELGSSAPRWRLFGHAIYQPMSPTTALSFISLTMGILYSRLKRREGWLGLFYTRGPEHLMARGLVPAAILAPILFGYLGRLAFRAGLRGTVYPLSLVVSGMIVLLLVIILLNARAMWRTDTKRRAAEAALAERERMQHAVLDNAGAGIIVVDAEARSVTSNKTMRSMLGLDETDMASMAFWSLTHEDQQAENKRLFDELINGKRDHYFLATQCARKDGSLFWGEMHTSVARDLAGKTEFVIAMLQDVTERKEAEEARQRLTAIIEATPDFVGVVDARNQVLYVNEAGRRMVGMPQDEVPSSSISHFHPPASASRVVKEGIPAAIEQGVWSGETQLKNRNGGITPVSQVILAHKRQNGEVAYLSTVMRDITDRKRLELAQHFLLEVSRASSCSLDTDTILRSLVKLVVPRHADYCAIHLFSNEGTIEKSAIARRGRRGRGITELLRVFPETRRPNQLIAQVARTGEPVVIGKMSPADALQLVRGRGHRDRLEKLGVRSLMAMPLKGRERVLGVICYMRSVTNKPFEGHRVALAREMAERIALSLDNAELHKRAREATRIRDEVLRVVAHDLRNPLNTISLTSDFLRIKLSGLPQEDWMSKLDIITRSVLHANRLIEDLLDVARLQTGRMTVETQVTKVGQLISEVIQLHQPLAEDRGLHLRVDVHGDCGFVLADPARAMQVFSNLIGNALKFSPRGTELVLRARQMDGKICFSIRDHGRGIALQDQPHLFDPFWQARKGKGGVGLGLPIARAIVQAHGGRMWFDSKPGLGTTFYFTLPVAHVQSSSEAAAD